MKFLDLFSGVGGFRLGLEKAGHECVGHCEIDKYANKSYVAIHNPKENEWFGEDITKVRANELPRADIWTFGFPCQDISVAGKQTGLEGARSGLFYTVTELIKSQKEEDKPSILFIENVKNLLSINDGWDFARVLTELDEVGYNAEWQILNSKDFGVPQNRERVFIIANLRNRRTRKIFPIQGNDTEIDIKVIGHSGSGGERGYIHDIDGIVGALSATDYKQPKQIVVVGNLDLKGRHESACRVYGIDGIAPAQHTCQGGGLETKIAIPVLTPQREVKRQNGRRFKKNGEPMFTLTGQDIHGVMIIDDMYQGREPRAYSNTAPTLRADRQGLKVVEKPEWIPGPEDINRTLRKGGKQTLSAKHNYDTVYDGFRIRRLTPKECFRLQSFPDWAFERARKVNSDSQLYKQAGNTVTVNVIFEIAKKFEIFDTGG